MRPKKKLWVAALLLTCALFAGCADKEAAGTLYIRALERYEQKDLKSAGAFINQCLECDKKNERAKFLKAKILFFQGQCDKASEILLDLKKNNSDNKDIQLYLIKSLILDGQLEQARAQIQGALKNDAGDWRLHRLSSIVAAKEDDTAARLQALNQASRALEGSAQVYFELASVWESLGIQGKAAELREKSLALDKGLADLF